MREQLRTKLLLTGRAGAGKTTVVRRVLERTRIPFGGFFTREMREGGRRTGFRIVTAEGQEAVLARVGLWSSQRVGAYGMSIEAIDTVAVPALEKALATAPLVVIDEIAKMELFSLQFQRTVLRCLDSPKPLLGVIQATSLPFLNAIRARRNVAVVEVTAANRDRLPGEIAARLEELFPC